MYIKVNEGKDDLNKALKQFTKLVKKSELLQELRNREHFLKPSKKRKFKSQEAIRRKKREERRIARQKKYDN
jgi:small subunit ribosomal protein S21